MLVPMAQLELIGRTTRLDGHLQVLQRLQAAEVVRLAETPDGDPPAATPSPSDGRRLDADLLARVDALLGSATAGDTAPGEPALPVAVEPGEARALVERAERTIEGPRRRLDALRAELDALPRSERSLAALLPLVPELVDLTDTDLARLRLATIVLVLDDPEAAVEAEIAGQLRERFGDRHLFVSALVDGARGCLLVLAAADVAAAEELLGRDRVAAVELPDRYSGRTLRATVEEMSERLTALPGLVDDARHELETALEPLLPELRVVRAGLAAAVERADAATAADLGASTYSMRLWVPRHRMTSVTDALTQFDPAMVLTEVPARRWAAPAPLLLRNTRFARPFERLVAFLAWPRAGSLDPTGLMAVVLPMLFGIMVGDVGYGLILAGIGLWARRRLGRRSVVAADAGQILLVGGAWATVFGLLFGEFLGDLGKALGMPALWFYRGGPEALTPLLLFVLGVGAAHMVLGLLLGLWLAVRERHVSHVLERGGSLLVLIGLFAVAGVATSLLPGEALPPAAVAVVIGVVAASVAHGRLGVLLGPLEAVARIGNVLSYLRLAAVGLASVYLAVVANELGRQAPLLVGIVIAAFFHALNLALAAFSPMIQSLRLHYVEFFGAFFDGGGRPFRPLGAGLPVPEPVTALPAVSPLSVPPGADPLLPATNGGRPAVAGHPRTTHT